jgi:hypothetical protein
VLINYKTKSKDKKPKLAGEHYKPSCSSKYLNGESIVGEVKRPNWRTVPEKIVSQVGELEPSWKLRKR